MDPADPHNLHDTADHPIIERVQVATQGQDCRACVERVRDPLMRVNGIVDVKVDEDVQAVFVRFDARKIQQAEVHEAILRTGYKPAATTES